MATRNPLILSFPDSFARTLDRAIVERGLFIQLDSLKQARLLQGRFNAYFRALRENASDPAYAGRAACSLTLGTRIVGDALQLYLRAADWDAQVLENALAKPAIKEVAGPGADLEVDKQESRSSDSRNSVVDKQSLEGVESGESMGLVKAVPTGMGAREKLERLREEREFAKENGKVNG